MAVSSMGGLKFAQQTLLKPFPNAALATNIGSVQFVADFTAANSNCQTSPPTGGVKKTAQNERCLAIFRKLVSQKVSSSGAVLQPNVVIIQRQFHTGTTFHCQESATKKTKNEEVGGSKNIEAVNIDHEIEANLEQMRKRDFVKARVSHPEELQHFRTGSPPSSPPPSSPGVSERAPVEEPPIGAETLPHPIWTEEEVQNVNITHKKPVGIIDNLAYLSVRVLRTSFDALSGYNRKVRDEGVWVNRICFLETVAGVPGMVGAMVRHLQSLRRMRRDHGWIHTLLEEAENERMHLMTALQLKQPGLLFRLAVVGAQGVMVSFFSLAYLVSPRYCHRFVGYLEEEAVVTYTKCLQDIESGELQHWKTQPAPYTAILYWKLSPTATMKDVILAIRADEAHHRVVNHTLGSMKPDDYNPYKPGQ